ncbi:LexA family protein [Acinetobacter soli]|uniref:LexA family protein n=1 Tax=Acinetobacter soli TaxID=487316 RepID=UPI001D0B28E0|nr:LexA family transcriptional regulator [Acinetobacter soli]MCB8769369.1 helix-turn-helix domain-containing protein [Acinetobacter soli]
MNELNTLAQRLRYAMEVLPPKKIKGVDLARAVGVKPPSVSDWLSGKSRKMEGENLLKVSKFLGVNANWLATGNGSPNNIKQINNDIKITNIKLEEPNLNKIPVFDFKHISLWKPTEANEARPLYYHYTDYMGTKREAVFGVIVQGKSMEPEFLEGDFLIVDATLIPKPGSFVIAQNAISSAIFKKYRVLSHDENGKDIFELVSLNDDFPKLSSLTSEIRIIGVVIQHIRYFKF